jgi:hypothetical protein
MAVYQQSILLGLESTYGEAAPLTQAFEVHNDSAKLNFMFLESNTIMAGVATPLADRRVAIRDGVDGDMEIDLGTAGTPLLFSTAFGDVTPPNGGTDGAANTWIFKASGLTPSSFTFQVNRSVVDAGDNPFTYLGCMVKSWTISQTDKGFCTFKIEFDGRDEDQTVAAGTPNYAAGSLIYNWTQAVVTVNNTEFKARSFEFMGSLNLKTDRQYLGDYRKDQPVPAGLGEYTGTIEADFLSLDIYNLYSSGETFPVTLTLTHAQTLSDGTHPSITLELGAVLLDTGTPVSSPDELSKQSITFHALSPDVDTPPAILTVVTGDSALPNF